VPSVVAQTKIQASTTRSSVLYVNPIPTRGLDVAIAAARQRPDLAFVFQESHRFARPDERVLARRLRGLGNVELRRFTADRPAVYRDAAVLLAPYTTDNRPRVVLEAQVNGIPLVAADRPGLDEAVGAGGVLVAPDAPAAAWAAALDEVLGPAYDDYVAAARRHAARPEVDPDTLTARFESALQSVLNARSGYSPPRSAAERSTQNIGPRAGG
jgi:glycosyltransferase involved in cell wall biosynthesis